MAIAFRPAKRHKHEKNNKFEDFFYHANFKTKLWRFFVTDMHVLQSCICLYKTKAWYCNQSNGISLKHLKVAKNLALNLNYSCRCNLMQGNVCPASQGPTRDGKVHLMREPWELFKHTCLRNRKLLRSFRNRLLVFHLLHWFVILRVRLLLQCVLIVHCVMLYVDVE